MEDSRWNSLAKGLALSTAYCTTYLAAWYLSFDQWFLPAGLRVACLLLLPYRYWPYMFAGDAGAMLTLRAPKADDYGEAWAYLSPFLPLPMMSLVALCLRRYIKTIKQHTRWLPLTALLLAASAALSNLTVNYVLSGPEAPDVFDSFLRFSTGQYLGILMSIPLLLAWLHRRQNQFPLKPLVQDSCIAIVMIGLMYSLVVWTPNVQDAYRQLMLMLMLLPAAFLAFLHGWRGASIGVVIVNLTISQTLTYTGLPGTHDDIIFIVQQALAIAAAIMLLFGSKITEHYEEAREAGVAESEALVLAHKSFLSTEHVLREQMLYMAQLQMLFDDERKDTVEWIKAQGYSQMAMDLNARGVMHRRLFNVRAPALYPIRIERDGLFAVIYSPKFTEFWAANAEVDYRLKGQSRDLTVDLQLAAYRCICHAMALLAESAPESYRIGIRIWHGSRRRGIALYVAAVPTQPLHVTQAGVTAAAMLNARVLAQRGIVRRDAHRVRVLLSEPLDAVTTPLDPVPVF